jgi:flagellar hook-associated protein 2
MVDGVSSSDALIQALAGLLSQSSSSASSSSSAAKSKGVGGLVSGMDTKAIVDSQIAVDRQPAVLLEKRNRVFTERNSAIRSLNTKLLSARLDLSSLKLSGAINPRTVASSTDTVATATATNSAAVGTSLAVEVTALAKAHQVATAGQAATTIAVGGGTIGIQVGSGAVTTVNIPAGSSTLPDIAKAINDAKTGVSAAVVNQGGSTPYRLVLTAGKTGSSNGITLTPSGDAGLTSLFTNPAILTQAADATIKLGSSNPITITSSTNTFTDLVPGISLTTKSQGTTTVTVGSDATKAKESINTFLTSMNSALAFAAEATKYDPTTKKAGVLQAESDVRRGIDDITRAMLAPVPGLPSTRNSLQSIGITFNRETRQFDLKESTLKAAIESDPDGVAAIFQNGGTSSNPGVSFGSLAAGSTLNGPVTVDITQAARQATIGTSGPVAGSTTVVAGVNDRLDLKVNGTAYSMQIAPDTYSAAQLVDAVSRGMANLTSEAPGDRVTAALKTDGSMLLATRNFGSAMTIETRASSTLLAALGLQTTLAAGADVAGTMNGVAATGNGQVLNAASGSASGLSVVVTSTTPVSGVTVTPRRGLAQAMQDRIALLSDSSAGLLTQKDNTYQRNIETNTKSIAAIDARLVKRRAYYDAKYLQMEQLSAKYQSMSTYLANNLSSTNNNKN